MRDLQGLSEEFFGGPSKESAGQFRTLPPRSL